MPFAAFVSRALGVLRTVVAPSTAPATAPSGRAPAPTRFHRPAVLEIDYAPVDDGRPDPGEIVWTWVPYEEDDGRGKDRPVLVVGRRGDELVGVMLTSKDHVGPTSGSAAPSRAPRADGRVWVDVGSGGWDPRGRASEARVDRLLPLDPAAVRREGAVLDRAVFARVAAEIRRVHGG
ncbi:type II toxin-antitoxin system PemK/MazF family toxin [Kineococcus gynurae]|uniref:Type II toxin-antitoxin system PemK/MazF family toxin n=1 Tax=Kineococcus gynurae TaxID=452979 RepID=A0ABV5LUS2_9ACTN